MNTKPSTTASAMNIVPSSSHDYVGKLKKKNNVAYKNSHSDTWMAIFIVKIGMNDDIPGEGRDWW